MHDVYSPIQANDCVPYSFVTVTVRMRCINCPHWRTVLGPFRIYLHPEGDNSMTGICVCEDVTSQV